MVRHRAESLARGREGRLLREGPCADRYHLLAIAIRPDCSPDRRTEVAVEKRAFRPQLTLKLLQRPARTADLEQLRVREQNLGGTVWRPVYIADTGAVIVVLGMLNSRFLRSTNSPRCLRTCSLSSARAFSG